MGPHSGKSLRVETAPCGIDVQTRTAGESSAACGRARRSAITDLCHLAAAFESDGPSPARIYTSLTREYRRHRCADLHGDFEQSRYLRHPVATGPFWNVGVSYTDPTNAANDFTGTLTFQLFQGLTPNTVSEISNLTNNGYYVNSGNFFNRILSGFVVQGGVAECGRHRTQSSRHVCQRKCATTGLYWHSTSLRWPIRE